MTSPKNPNILFIFTDQHRLSALGCYGETPCQTPNLDRLAAQGVRFETAYTVCPVCSPARGTIMTGLYPHSHGICANVHNLGCAVHELEDHPDLLSRRLEQAGYFCGYSGKWHLGSKTDRAFISKSTMSVPTKLGFTGQDFPGHGGGGFIYPEYQEYLKKNGFTHEVIQAPNYDERMPAGILSGPEESTVPYFLTENSIELMEQAKNEEKPFFLWHNFWGPHSPYYATQEYYDIYRDIEIPEWPNYQWDPKDDNMPRQVKIHPHADSLTWEDWAEAIRHYYAFTTMIDRQIGRMLDYLEESGLAENTIVIFSSDHGETLGSHGGLTDKGWHHFEETQRIPFIIKTPEKFKTQTAPGSVKQDFLSSADIYPTILDIAGIQAENFDRLALQGKSILPLLRGESVQWRDSVFTEFYGVNNASVSMISVRHGDMKYGWNCSNIDELYDLKDDPYEMNNLIKDSQYAIVLSELREIMADWMKESGFPGRNVYCLSTFGEKRQ